jgi:transposase
MNATYSIDLRERAVDLVKSGRSVTEIARLLKISRNSIYLWLKRDSLKASPRIGKKPIIASSEDFELFIKTNGGLSVREMAAKLSMHPSTFYKYYHKFKYSVKKVVRLKKYKH